ncbi:type II toxin-antitoxin system toxin DNA ADP-ribosyl transferase DarT [Paractinoplanes brasiliensis]|uniref:Uncharacterized protein DUF4433 n=1 Tax=Paractinoplanes brasiliensis TaxID=52695 RepID=A0A4R6JXA7_9ACTN|nr:DUF4433 domain-containing protein [Actinoplanes brasiliensis]TDO41420.1 uncharacterized protein DUF4433 [Actinoplanes brasiliensis]GID27296.1 hypothetical protein Abr02nite_22790 [Actinoplanes brasiliensis]
MTDADVSTAGTRWLYHFTHIENLAAIRQAGSLSCDLVARTGMTHTEVGARDIKESRRRRRIPIHPGGHVGDYVPFYFAPRSPMMYRISCEHRDRVPDRYQGGDKPLVYLVSTVRAVVDASLLWVATDGNAATATSEFTSSVEDMLRMIDWPLMEAERWNNTPEDPDRQRRRQAEFLVHRTVPLDVVSWVGVHDDRFRSRAGNVLAGHRLGQRIIVRPGWYYGFERR